MGVLAPPCALPENVDVVVVETVPVGGATPGVLLPPDVPPAPDVTTFPLPVKVEVELEVTEPDGVYGGRLVVAIVNVVDRLPPRAPGVCASVSGENRTADVVTVAVALFDIVIVVPEIALTVEPNGTFG